MKKSNRLAINCVLQDGSSAHFAQPYISLVVHVGFGRYRNSGSGSVGRCPPVAEQLSGEQDVSPAVKVLPRFWQGVGGQITVVVFFAHHVEQWSALYGRVGLFRQPSCALKKVA